MSSSKKKFNSSYRSSDTSDEDLPLSHRHKYSVKKNRALHLDPDTSTDTNESFQANNSIDVKREWDKYCWNCHKQHDYEVKCKNCVITFHRNANCTPYNGRNNSIRKCKECRKSERPEKGNFGNINLNELLKILLERSANEILSNNQSFATPVNFKDSPLLAANPIMFEDVKKKLLNLEYETTHEFLLDIKWIKHNYEILCNASKKEDELKLENARNLIKTLQEMLVNGMEILKYCGECYKYTSNERFFPHRVCSMPHILLWCQFDVYPYWPAKLVRVCEGPEPMLVFFFGENTIANVKESKCYLYSKEDPNEYITDTYKEDVKNSMNEAAIYIKNIEERFGPFHYAPLKTNVIKKEINFKHLDEMIPGYRNLSLRNTKSDVNDSSKVLQSITVETISNDNASGSKIASIPLTKTFISNMKGCRDYLFALKDEYELQKIQISQDGEKFIALSQENEMLRRKYETECQAHNELKRAYDRLLMEKEALKTKLE